MAVTHQLEITAQEAALALSTSEDIDNRLKTIEQTFKEKYGEVTPERQNEYTVALRVMCYYAIADPAGLRGRLASVIPGDTVIIGGDAPAWYYGIALQQALKFNPSTVLFQLDPEHAVTVYSATVSDVPSHVGPNTWHTKEAPKPVEQEEQPAIEEIADKPIESDG